MNKLKEGVRKERELILFKSKELNKYISERDSSIELYKSKQFMFENIVSNKNSLIENEHIRTEMSGGTKYIKY